MSEPSGLYIRVNGEIDQGSQIPLEGVKVDAEVIGCGAKVTVTQRYKNKELTPVEAVYKFPLPERAAVCGFGGVIGGREIRGEVEEREKAFEIYDKALEKGDLATLLDQERPNIFTLSVGRIDPGAEAVIRVDYVTLLDSDGKTTRFLLPTTISPRYLPEGTPDRTGIPEADLIHPPYAEEVPYGLSLAVRIRKGSLLRSAESPSHQIRVERLDGDTLQVTLAQEKARMDRDFILSLEGERAQVGRAYRQVKGDDEYLQVDFCPPADERTAGKGKAESRQIVFLLDCSGSMGGDSIAEVRRAVEICLKAMKEGTLFNVCRFGSRHESLFPAPVLYSAELVGEALEYVRKMDADLGGTEILGPLRDILSRNGCHGNGGRDIVLLTDGEVGNEAEIFKLLKKSGNGARVFPVGIGAGCNEHFIKGLARAGKGASEFIYPGERIEPKTLRLFGLLGSESVTGLTVSTKGEQAPADPALFVGRPAAVFVKGRKGEFAKKVAVKAEVNGVKKAWEVEVVDAGGENLPIPLLWARERIRDLEEGLGVKGSRQAGRKKAAVEKEVIALSKQYGILSQSTSYVAVRELEEEDRYTGEVKLRKVPALVTAGWHGIGSVTGARRMRFAQACAPAHKMMAAFDVSPVYQNITCDLYADTMLSVGPLPIRNESRVGFASSTPGARRDGKREAILLAILSSQRPGGGFEPREELAGPLGFSFGEVEHAARAMTVRVHADEAVRPDEALTAVSTAVVLSILEQVFPEERRTWEGVAEKSRNWLHGFMSHYQPEIHGQDLMRWAGQIVQRHVRLS